MVLRDKTEMIAACLAASGILDWLEGRRGQGKITLLAYHSVLNITEETYPFDEGTVSASCKGFDQQMKFVSKNFDVMTFHDLKKCAEGKCPLPPRPLLVTFDDGFANNYYNAFPILKRYSVPTTFFLVTDLVGTNEIFWWEKVVYWVKHTSRFLDVWREIGNPMPQQTREIGQFILTYLKKIENSKRCCILAQMEKECPPIAKEHHPEQVRPLNWNEVLEMSEAGMEFGSHSATHSILSLISKEKLLMEINGSKKAIEAHIGKEVVALAYPVGSPSDFNDKVIQVVREAGYRFGVTYSPSGINNKATIDWYRMKRITVERNYSFNRFRCELALHSLYSDVR